MSNRIPANRFTFDRSNLNANSNNINDFYVGLNSRESLDITVPSIATDTSGIQIGAFADINDATTLTSDAASLDSSTNLRNMRRTLENIIAERQSSLARQVGDDQSTFSSNREMLTATIKRLFVDTAEFLRNVEAKNPTEEEIRALCERGIVQIPITENIDAAIALLNEELANIASTQSTPLESFKVQSEYYFNKYFNLSREIIKVNSELKLAIGIFTKFEKQLDALSEIQGQGPEYDALNQAYFEIVKKQAASLNIEESYKKYLSLTKQWAIIRDLALLHRIPATNQSHAPTCSVCIDDPISIALNPCGHTFCSNCYSQLSRHCPICRRNFNNSVRLYFS